VKETKEKRRAIIPSKREEVQHLFMCSKCYHISNWIFELSKGSCF